MKKRWLAMLVVGCMLIGSMGMTAMAENEPDGSNNGATNLENDVQESGSTSVANTDFVVDENGVLTKYTGSGGAVTIPDNVTSIVGAFRGNDRIISVTIPGTVENIGGQAFAECRNLTSVTIQEGVADIGQKAFAHCTGLTSVNISGSVQSIGRDAFMDCGITDLTIPEGVKSIGAGAFLTCTKLTSVTIPASVTSIESGGSIVFGGCTGLQNVTIEGDMTGWDSHLFSGCNNLKSITFTGTPTVITGFTSCTSLASITIPPSVTTIGSYALAGTGLTNITIPVSVTSIEQGAFWDCKSLTGIDYAGTKAQWAKISISNEWPIPEGVIIHCTDGDVQISSSQTTPETPQPEESKPAAEESKPTTEEPKKNPGSSSSHNSSGSSQNNKTAPAPSAPKTEQEVVKETIENLPQGGQAVLETDSVIGSGGLRKIMEKGGSMVVFSPQVSWHFDALTNGDMDFNPGIEVGADIPDLMQKLNGQSAASANATVLRFAHNGVLPGAAHAGIAVSYAPGTRLYFYYYNRSTGLFEFQQSVTVEEGGYVVVNLTHCSDYVLTTEPLSGNLANGPVPAAGTGSGANGAAQGKLDSTPHTGI